MKQVSKALAVAVHSEGLCRSFYGEGCDIWGVDAEIPLYWSWRQY